MKKLLLILIFVACKKEDTKPVCQTCTLDVHFVEYGCCSNDYVEKTVDNCDHAIQDGQMVSSGGWTNGNVHYFESKIWHCN